MRLRENVFCPPAGTNCVALLGPIYQGYGGSAGRLGVLPSSRWRSECSVILKMDGWESCHPKDGGVEVSPVILKMGGLESCHHKDGGVGVLSS